MFVFVIIHASYSVGGTHPIWMPFCHYSLATRIPINLSSIPPKTASEWVKSILNPINLLGLCPFFGPSFPLLDAIACDCLWWSRSKLIFEDISPPSNQLADEINRAYKSHSNAWLSKSPTSSARSPLHIYGWSSSILMLSLPHMPPSSLLLVVILMFKLFRFMLPKILLNPLIGVKPKLSSWPFPLP